MSGCSGNCSSCGESCSDRKQESQLTEPNQNSQLINHNTDITGTAC